MIKKILIESLLLLTLTTLVLGTPDSQWRGPNRDGIYPEKNLLSVWPENGPQLLWSFTGLGEGFSTVAVAHGKIYTTGMLEDGNGHLFVFDTTGKLLWKAAYAPEWKGNYPGARSTPTIVGEQLYILSGAGWLVCMNSNTGKKIWSFNILEKFGGKNIQWGLAESVLIDGNRVICTPGGRDASVVALDRMTGQTIWTSKGHSEDAAYCSPALIQHGTRCMIVTMTKKSIIGLDAETGKFLWRHHHETEYDIHPNTPLYQDGYLYCLSGYGTGGVKLQLSPDGNSVKEIWRNTSLDSQFGAAILYNGYIYGSGHNTRRWQCLDWRNGNVRYESSRRGKGNIIFADGRLYCYDEKGEVMLVEPNPAAFKIISSFRVTQGTNQHWAHLVINAGRLFVRHGDTLLVYSIRK